MKRSVNFQKMLQSAFIIFAMVSLAIAMTSSTCQAICATVKIEIHQELTLERQAFDAHMRINNGLSDIPIEDVTVTVNFADENSEPVHASSDPDDTSALFFIRVDTMDNISNVEGSGSVAPETSADIHWLIIPAPGASNGLQSGTLYYVGATLSYTVAGEVETIEVNPDYIFVKPMPQLELDYFLPTDVYGDDAQTSEIEPPVPFSLGLRIRNKGYGAANNLKVESAQPQIVDNELGLLIGFQIDGSTVNGQPATDSLLADFGTIAPNTAGTARWIMSCTLSGRFIEFDAELSHADELGGQMTSLIDQDDVNTHFLVRDVMVDAQGRDSIEDFLALDDDVYRVYESDNTETEVTDQSGVSSLTNQGTNTYQLTSPPTAGFTYVQLDDPYNGQMVIDEVIRSDGKQIKAANAWLSKTRAGSGPWQYAVNLFDHNSPGTYTFRFLNPADTPQPPVIMYIPERSRVEGQQLSFIVEATDPNGTTPSLMAERLPVAATFADQGDGSGIFDWTPTTGQSGQYAIRFIASDGVLESSRQAIICILSADDTDGDTMQDSWEMAHFGTLDRDGSGDFDSDGISDMDEFLNGLDPTHPDSVPSTPEIVFPLISDHVNTLSPALEIINSIDPENDAITYQFELYADNQYTALITSQDDIAPQTDTTQWAVPVSLDDDTHYYWRVKAQDATGSSNWAYGHFFVNTQNDAPSAPGISYPADGAGVDNTTPLLEITNSTDSDEDELAYTFEIYTDSSMTTLVHVVHDIASGADGRTQWQVDSLLDDDTIYHWRAIAEDGNGAQTPSDLASFQVNTVNAAPTAPVINQPADHTEIVVTLIDLTVDNATDPDGDSLSYIFELDTSPTFNSPALRTSGPLAPDSETTTWPVDTLEDDTRYYWRVKTTDGSAQSPWTSGSFFVNTINNAPPVPTLKNPGSGAWVSTQTPQLAVHPVRDPDNDNLDYRFEVYGNQELNDPAGFQEQQDPAWLDIADLQASRWYFWRVQAIDEHGVASAWSDTGTFFIKINTVNLAPQLTFIQPVEEITTNAQAIILRWSDTDPDSNASISFYYDTDSSGEDGVLIAENIDEDPDGTEDYHDWDISALEGTFYIYATITDTHATQTVYAPAAIIIDRTAPTPSADPPGGTYGEPLSVTLTADEPAQIHYTLDGSVPDFNSGQYASPIAITEETTLNVMAIDSVGNQSVTITETYLFETDITVSVRTDKGRTLDGVRVYAFTDADSYTGRNGTTDGNGQATFIPDDFTAGDYKFRIDYLGHHFWSQTVDLPVTRAIDVVIAEEAVTVTVMSAGGPAEGIRVYLFSASGSYLGIYLVTDANGQVIFDLPVGIDFTFRADLYGNQYWSDVTTIQTGGGNAIPVNAGGGHLQINVGKTAEIPLSGIRIFLFNTANSYLGFNATTNADGHVDFNVPEGSYKVRADYLGYQFWSADTFVTTDTQIALTIPHQQTQVTVDARFAQSAEPLENVRVYLFSATNSYLGQYAQTDGQGRVTFDLPQKAYKVRADHMSQQYWSDAFTWQDPIISIPMSDAQITVTGAGQPLADTRVYLFSGSGAYLSRYDTTDENGQILFRLPEGQYNFRADHQGSQYWSGVQTLAADQHHEIGISTGGGTFTFTVWAGPSEPLANVRCFVFDENGSFLNLQDTTDTNGEVSFNLSDGSYQIRVDYLSHPFWSSLIQVPDALSAELTIAHTTVEATVLSAGQPAPDVRVYLFNGQQAYQGLYLETDADGMAAFDLPVDVDFMFRADLFNNQYWSDTISVPQVGPEPVTIDTGGGNLQLSVEDGNGNPMPGLQTYLFNDTTAYLDLTDTTDTNGQIAFDLSEGYYKIRVDYQGYHFWTNTILVDQDVAVTLPIDHQQTTITVQGALQGVNEPLAGIRAYLFTPTGTYLGQYQDTDAGGQVQFNLPQQDYMVRADYMGLQFWSDPFNSQDSTLTIPMAQTEITVTGAGLPRADIRVYLYTESGTYLGEFSDTDVNGQVNFRLPAASYQFRADYQSSQYWSGVQALAADQINPVIISVGGGTFAVQVQQDAATPMAGLHCYVFNQSGAYIGLYGATSNQGEVYFDLAQGQYQFRVDYLGYQYWSSIVTIPDSLQTAVVIPHQEINVSLNGRYLSGNDPLRGQRLYLFTPAGQYMGIHLATDDNGAATIPLPDQPYQVRADYLGSQYWSPLFQSQDTAIQIPQGMVDLHAHRSGLHAEGARVYLFSIAGRYLDRYLVTDTNGLTSFLLPQGTYRFRVDSEGVQQWSGDITVSADLTANVEVDLDQ